MVEYIFILLFVIFCSKYNYRMAANTRVFFVCTICLLIIFVLGLRFKVGIDTLNYMESFKSIPTFEDLSYSNWTRSRLEPGYFILASICKSICPDFTFLQFSMAGITNICIFIFIYRNTKNPFCGLFFYLLLACLYFTTEIMRESVAVGIFLLNYRNIRQKKWGWYILGCILSMSFHYSAIITLFIPCTNFIKLNIWYILCIVALIMVAPFLETLNQLLNIVAIQDKLTSYSKIADNVNLNFRLAFFMRLGIPALIALWATRRYKKITQNNNMILLHIMLCAGIFAIPIIFARLANYSLPFVIVALSNIISSSKPSKLIKAIIIFIVIISQSHYYYTMRHAWIPYVSILNKQVISARERLWWQNFGN